MNACGRFERWINAHLDGELDAEQGLQLHRHLAGCAPCAERYHRMERLNQTLKSSFASSVEPMEGLPDLVMAALAREPYRPSKRSFTFRLPTLAFKREWVPRTGWAVAAVAGITAFTLGLKPWSEPRIPSASPQSGMASASPAERENRTSAPVVLTEKADATLAVNPALPTRQAPSSLNPRPARRTVQETPRRAVSVPQPQTPERSAVAAVPVKTAPPTPPAVKAKAPAPLGAPKAASAKAESVQVERKAQPETLQTRKQPRLPAEEGVRLASSERSSLRLHQVAGVAETRSDEEIDWTNIPLDAPLRVDQRVRSGDDSRIALALGGGLELRMNEDTEIVPIRAPQSDSPFWVIQLVKGEVFARIPKGECGIKIMTPGNVAVAKEGEFIVRSNELLETRLLVAKGRATLENDLGRSIGTEGLQISSRMGIAPDPALPALDLNSSFRWAYAPIVQDERLLHRPG